MDLTYSKTREQPLVVVKHILAKPVRGQEDKDLYAILLVNPNTRALINKYGKSRCHKAKVLRIIDATGKGVREGYSSQYNRFKYQTGKIVKCRKAFDTDEQQTCTSGIHFFLSAKDLKKYWHCPTPVKILHAEHKKHQLKHKARKATK